MTTPDPAEIPASSTTFRPDAHTWAALATEFYRNREAHRGGIAGADSFARDLGLPSGPLVFSGHQATFWHPGILAKLFASTAVTAKIGSEASAVWLVVDQDATDAARIELPATTPEGVRSSTVHTLSSDLRGAIVTDATPSLARPRLVPPTSAGIAAIASLAISTRASLEALANAIAKVGASASQSLQVSMATDTLLAPVLGQVPPTRRLLASGLSRTTLFRELCRRMLADPAACTHAYNQAASEYPDAGLRPLECAGTRVELPLWKLGSAKRGTPRERVLASELEALLSAPDAGAIPTLLPRALLMTALVRLAGACLFIHGLGGEKYDPATERWLALWLTDVPSLKLAPATIATASLYLKQDGTPPAQTQHARNVEIQRLRRVRYDPLSVHDESLDQAKHAVLAEIEAHPRRSPQRREAYIRLTHIIEQHRTAHTADVLRAEAARHQLLARTSEANIPDIDPALRRDWPFCLYPTEALIDLRDRVYNAIGAPTPYHR